MYDTLEAPKQQGNYGTGIGIAANQEETLASITPRVLTRAKQTAERSNQIAASLGIVPPSPPQGKDGSVPLPSPTLINALREMENALDFALGRLDSIHQHING